MHRNGLRSCPDGWVLAVITFDSNFHRPREEATVRGATRWESHQSLEISPMFTVHRSFKLGWCSCLSPSKWKRHHHLQSTTVVLVRNLAEFSAPLPATCHLEVNRLGWLLSSQGSAGSDQGPLVSPLRPSPP